MFTWGGRSTAQAVFVRRGRVYGWREKPLIFSPIKLYNIKISGTRIWYFQTEVIQCNQTSKELKGLCGLSIPAK